MAEPSVEQMRAELAAAEPSVEQMRAELAAAQNPSLLDQAKKLYSENIDPQADLDAVKAAGLGAAKFASFGYSPQIAGAGNAAIGAAKNMSLDDLSKDYQAGKDATIKANDEAWDKHPYAYGAGATAGAVLSPLNKVLAPVKAGFLASKIPMLAAESGAANLGAHALAAGANGALSGAVMNPGDNPGQSGDAQLAQRGSNALFGGALGSAAGTAIEGAPGAAKSMMSTFLGPSKTSIDKYLQSSERINNAPDVSQLKDLVDQKVGDLRNATSNAQSQLEAQTEALHPRKMADDVHGAVSTLKDQVVNESKAARNIIANSGIAVRTEPVLDSLTQAIEDQKIAGQEPFTESGQQTIAKLRALKSNLEKYPATLSGNDAKNFVQHIDSDTQYLKDAGGFSDEYSNALKDVRRAVDKQMKGFTPYDQQMQIVSDKAQLLNKANKAFGTPEKAHSAMNTIASDAKGPQQELLQELGAHTGQDFTTPLKTYMDIKAGKSVLPIQDELAQAQQNSLPYKNWGPQNSQSKLQSLISKPEGRANIETQRQLDGLDALRGNSSEPSILQSIDDNRVRSDFSKDQTRGSRNAVIWKSLGAGAGAAGGFLVPGSHYATVPMGAAIGSGVGGYIDKNGGAMAKGMLDNYINNQALYDGVGRQLTPARIANPWTMIHSKDKK